LGTVVVGGLWAYYRLYKRREHAVRLEFTVALNFVGVQHGKWLVSLDAHVNNEGFVRHEITRFDMELRCLLKTDRLATSPELGGQVVVPHQLLQGSWLPGGSEMTFIEPGLKTIYSFVFGVPVEASFVLLHGYLDYRDGGHSAEVLAAVPPAGSPVNSP
jgi:hypothetical protein